MPAPPSNGDGDTEMDEFLRESRHSLTGKYWEPVDSLVPVRLVDMREEAPKDEPSAPAPARRLRRLDMVVGAVGVAAMILLVVFLRKKDDAAPVQAAAPAQVTATPQTVAIVVSPAVVAKSRIAEPPHEPIATASVPEPVAAAPAPESAAAPASEPAASSAPKPHRPKAPKAHTPPTASFPD
jgi:hypothetical protein